jgi:hypothetical protein
MPQSITWSTLSALSMFLVTYLKAATRAACSRITRALSSSGVPAGSPLTLTNGLPGRMRMIHPRHAREGPRQ